tara:strand:- start:720 stop:1454 length:735 start_codon:yes stop_codon:yes gene_type:complete
MSRKRLADTIGGGGGSGGGGGRTIRPLKTAPKRPGDAGLYYNPKAKHSGKRGRTTEASRLLQKNLDRESPAVQGQKGSSGSQSRYRAENLKGKLARVKKGKTFKVNTKAAATTKTSAPGRSGIEAPRTKASATTKAKAVLKKMAAERSGSTYKRITPERAKAEGARERMELKHAKKRQHEMRDKIKPHKVPMKNADPRTPKQRQADKATDSSPAIQNRRKAILKAQNTLKKLKQGKTVLRRNNE